MGVKGIWAIELELDYQFGLGSDGPICDPFYARLWNVLPDEDGTGGTECTGTGYNPVAIDAGAVEWDRSGIVVSHLNDIDFGTGDPDWGTIEGVTLHDAATGTNLFRRRELLAPFVVTASPVIIPAGSLEFSEE